MKSIIYILSSLLLLALLPVSARDPFWPIGYNGSASTVTSRPADVPTPKVTHELTDEELRKLAGDTAAKIRESLVRKGTMIAGDKIYAYVQDKWLTVGDVLTVEVEGGTYRLEILNLTSDNIELEAHRAVAPLQKQPRKNP